MNNFLLLLIVIFACLQHAIQECLSLPIQNMHDVKEYPDLVMNLPLNLTKSVSNVISAFNEQRNATELYFTSPCNQIYDTLPPTNPFDAVYKITNPYRAFSGVEAPNVVLVTENTAFPTHITMAPDEIANNPVAGFVGPVLAVSSGRFPLPAELEAPGEIFLVDSFDGRKILITEAGSFEDKWYYSKFYFYDVDGDGDLDILAQRCREIGPIIPFFSFWSQLVWFEQPDDSPLSLWVEHILVNPDLVINDGPDGGSFSFADIDGDGVPELVAAEGWSFQVTMYYPIDNDWSNPESIRRINIVPKDSIGLLYDAHLDDINGDGWIDLLVTNHIETLDDVYPPALLLFLIPRDFKTNPTPIFTKIEIDTSLDRWYEEGKQAPGYVITFRSKSCKTQQFSKPQIALAGDGTGEWYIYTPTSQDPNVNTYTRHIPSPQCAGDNIKPYYVSDIYDFSFSHAINGNQSNESYEVIMCGCLGVGELRSGYFPPSKNTA